MSDAPRRPAAFRIEPEPAPPTAVRKPADAPRKPRTARPGDIVTIVPPEADMFEGGLPEALSPPPPAVPRRRRSWLARTFFSAFGIVLSLAVGLWLDGLIRDLYARADWLGWAALAATGVAVLALLAMIVRELAGLRRLASVEQMRGRAVAAVASTDQHEARRLVADLSSFLSSRPETAAGRRSLAALKDDIIDGPDLVRVAETELLLPLDEHARILVVDAAKRVSLVTAVSPRALVDIAYVAFESARLIRRLAELYGARPATLGFFRLARSVLAHLAITGTIAAGDSIVQQLVGQGLAARLSARLGEGVVNGMMTARIGIAAMEAVRPLPFDAVPRPGLGDIVSVLVRFTRSKADEVPAERA